MSGFAGGDTNYSANADVWDFRRDWAHEKQRTRERASLRELSLLTARPDQARGWRGTHLRCSRDALVLKALALVLGSYLSASRRCTHLKAMAAPNTPCARSAIICRVRLGFCGGL